jgi:UDP-N-acetylglucosamine 2-epimerase (non-hydrolysing)
MIHVFIGTKAQLIKMAPVMRRLQQAGIQYNFIFSGQHKATIDDIRTEFGLKEPDVKLYDGPDITGILQMLFWSVRVFWFTLRHRKEVWRGDRNGIVLNHGDTFSTLLGTILAKVSGLKSAHVESGLRSFNLFHPFPEEITRRLTFSFSSLFFAPGQWAMDNLAGYRGIKINTQYNTLLDALKSYQASISDADVQIPEFKYGIVSIHRFENIFSRKKLERLTEILTNISNQQRLLLILHRPTQKKLQQFRLIERIEKCENIELRPRYSYFQFIRLMKNAHFVITDGGSNQEECYYLGKPCLIMRKATERKDGLGHNACLCYYQDDIIDDFIRNIDRFQQPELVHEGLSPSEIIVNTLKEKGYCD